MGRMKSPLFSKEFTFKSRLSSSEIIEELITITENFYTDSDDLKKFEGEVEESQFVILPTFDFGPKQQLRPEIKGTLIIDNNETKVFLSYGLPKSLSLLFKFALILNLSVMIFMIFTQNSINLPFWDKWWLIPIILVFTGFIIQFSLNQKMNKSNQILKKLLRMS